MAYLSSLKGGFVMGISLSLKMDIYLSNSDNEEVARAFIAGVESGMNMAEYLLESGVKVVSSKAYMYIAAHRETEIQMSELIENLSELISVRVKEKWFKGTKYMGTELQTHYLHGMLEGYDSVFSVFGETKSQTGSVVEAGRLTDRFIKRVRLYIESLE